MKKIISIVFLTFTIAVAYGQSASGLRLFQFNSSVSLVTKKGTIPEIEAPVTCVSYQDMFLYVTRVINTHYADSEGTIASQDTLYRQHVIKKNERFGLRYVSKTDSVIRFPVDTFYNYNNLAPETLGNPGDFQSPKTVKLNPVDKTVVLEKFALKGEHGGIDSVYMEFNYGLKDAPFTIWKTIDLLKSSKLTSFTLLTAPIKHPDPQYSQHRLRFNRSFREVPVKDPEEYLNYFRRFLADRSRFELQ